MEINKYKAEMVIDRKQEPKCGEQSGEIRSIKINGENLLLIPNFLNVKIEMKEEEDDIQYDILTGAIRMPKGTHRNAKLILEYNLDSLEIDELTKKGINRYRYEDMLGTIYGRTRHPAVLTRDLTMR